MKLIKQAQKHRKKYRKSITKLEWEIMANIWIYKKKENKSKHGFYKGYRTGFNGCIISRKWNKGK